MKKPKFDDSDINTRNTAAIAAWAYQRYQLWSSPDESGPGGLAKDWDCGYAKGKENAYRHMVTLIAGKRSDEQTEEWLDSLIPEWR